MLPNHTPAPQSPTGQPRRIGVGIDTARYGHYAAFLRDDLQPAAAELPFAESGTGYAQLRQRLEHIGQRYGTVHLDVRLDAAGQYADNLLHFLHSLATTGAAGSDPLSLTLSCGDPQRNKNYRAALYGHKKSDPIEARAAARYALAERPQATAPLSAPLRTLRQVAGRLQAVVRQRTRLINQFHHLTVEELLRDQLRQLRDVRARQKRLEKLLVGAYRALPKPNHLDTISGIGAVTAAVLTAFILDIDNFETPGQLVAYFGALPIEVASGVDRDGQARGPRRYVMSRRGNDLVRRYLWMAALSAVRHNPAVKALYCRVVAKHPQHKAIAIGHAMRKLLHLVFAVCKTGRPFDPQHYPWQTPAHVEVSDDSTNQDLSLVETAPNQTAGHKRAAQPARKVVTAAWTDTVAGEQASDDGMAIDFTHLKRQLPMGRVLDQLGLASRLRGSSPQRRCTCPIHRGDARGRTFSVHLEHGVFQCFDQTCAKKGDVIDLWASVRGMSRREAALDLVRTFGLEPVPGHGTEERKG